MIILYCKTGRYTIPYSRGFRDFTLFLGVFMNSSVLIDNLKKRKDHPIWMLICFAMFNCWQMGFVYFMTPSLVIDGRVPLPITEDNVTLLIAAGYLLAILVMIFLPCLVVWGERVSVCGALVSIAALFVPMAPEAQTLLLYIHSFFCFFMIGFESFIIINLFSEKTAVLHLTVGYSVALLMISLVQNDILPLTFSAFRWLTVIMLLMMLVFFFRLPSAKESYPVYVKKRDGISLPKKLFWGVYILVFVSCIMMLAGPTAVAVVKHGIFVSYLSDALATLAVYILYRRFSIHPMRTAPVFTAFSAVGFLFLFISSYLPGLAYISCVFIGFGFVPCQFLPLYGNILMKNYPSRYITPIIMGLAVVTVVIQSALVEIFRSVPEMLYLAYAAITVVLTVIFLQLAPHLIYAFDRKIEDKEDKNKMEEIEVIAETASPLDALTKREREVLDLIGCGYSNADIAKVLFISEHTVNDYTKKIYRKLDVHSRHAAAQIVNKYNK